MTSSRRFAGGTIASLLAISLAFACTPPAGMGSAGGGGTYDASEWKYWAATQARPAMPRWTRSTAGRSTD